jgi:hypothetical protein
MSDEGERDYKGSRFEMTLIGSGWLKETRAKRKYQRFIINNDVELKAKDIICVYLARTKKDVNSPAYYMFHDINARLRKKRGKTDNDAVEHDNVRDSENPDDF